MNTRIRLISTATVIAILTGGFVWFIVQSQPSQTLAAVPTVVPMTSIVYPEVTPEDVQLALHRCGLDPESLAAAGVAANAIEEILDDAEIHLAEHLDDLEDADLAVATARQNADQLQRLVQSGLGSEGDPAAFASAQAALVTAEADRAQVLAGLFDAATDSLDAGQTTVLTALNANRGWSMPLQYLVVNRSEAQWVQLRNALANERISSARDVDPDTEAQTFLETVRGDADVLAAAAALATNAALNAAAWETAMNPVE